MQLSQTFSLDPKQHVCTVIRLGDTFGVANWSIAHVHVTGKVRFQVESVFRLNW